MPTPPWLERRVIAYAHQGGAWEYPSSTLLAIDHALSVGATAVELDVHATRDGELVVCHDATVDRTTEGQGPIASMTLAQVRTLDPAYWFVPGADVTPGLTPEEYPLRGRAPDDPLLRIATLREILERYPGVVLNLDIKQTAPAVPAYEAALAHLLLEHGRTDDVIVASFLDQCTEEFRRHAPGIPTSAGTQAVAEFWRAVHADEALPRLPHVALQVPESQGDLVVVDVPFVEAAHEAGLAVHVWTINEEEAMRRLLTRGVDGVISDLPTSLAGVLADEGVAWPG